jgi:putative DNA primase/helicase
MQRFGLLVWPDVPQDWVNVDRAPNREFWNSAIDVFQMLERLDWRAAGARRDFGPTGDEMGEPYLRLAADGHEQFLAWRTELERRLRKNELDPTLESHLAKYRKLVPALALVGHLADRRTGEVSAVAVERALQWAAYLETHAARTYASTTIASADAARAILAKIKSGHLKAPFGSRDVWRPQWSRLTDRDTVQEALQMLVGYDWLAVEVVATNGRPATVYSVNPKALTV